jgi:benzoyl-CoA reductase/2-hydroxyglutaryl-CoA dehydratase subunit BcrC/BadD/HgdB
MDAKVRLAQLKAKLAELKARDPSHCSGTKSFIGHTGHSMSPELFQEIEELEEQVRKLEKEQQ